MASWIVTIGPKHPEHWESANDVKFWDITNTKDIRSGDDVFFWQSGRGLVGWTRATNDAVAIDENMEPGPWNDGRDYRLRFSFSLVSTELRTTPRWNDMATGAGLTELPRNGQVFVPSSGERFMRSLFGTPQTAPNSPDSVEYPDTRRKVMAAVHLRLGQPEFRARLRKAYRDRCAITGSSVTEILEAAHIRPYRGKHSHRTENGILLRSDFHTLFDLHFITFEYDEDQTNLFLRMDERLSDTEYAYYADRPIELPEAVVDRPSVESLEAHRSDCDWL